MIIFNVLIDCTNYRNSYTKDVYTTVVDKVVKCRKCSMLKLKIRIIKVWRCLYVAV